MKRNGIDKMQMEYLERALVDFFKKAGREHLPWRKRGIAAYEVWVSEIMLQQTQVSRVIGYYTRFLLRFPNIETLAKADWEEFLPYYAGLGYYARGRNMLRTAKEIMEKYDGKFPSDPKMLETLPGIGSYTAAAIASFAYGTNTIAWDTNVRRVVGRFFFGTKQIGDWVWVTGNRKFGQGTTQKPRNFEQQIQEKFGEAFSVPAKILNAALMDFGSAICLGKPKCAVCPLRERCWYFREKGKGELRISNHELRRKNGGLDQIKRMKGNKGSKMWKEAGVMVFLHENHKRYFSSERDEYRPFIFGAEYNTRAGVKQVFRERYGLEVSVRPSHGKVIMKGMPLLLINVQVLSGEPSFDVFSKKDKVAFQDNIK